MDDYEDQTEDSEAERTRSELKRVPEPKVRKGLASFKKDTPSTAQKRRGNAEAPTSSTRPSKPPKPLKRKNRPAARNTDVCDVLTVPRERHEKQAFHVNANPSAVVIQPWSPRDDSTSGSLRDIRRRPRAIDEDLCCSAAMEGTSDSCQGKPRYAFVLGRKAAVGVNATSRRAATAEAKPRKGRSQDVAAGRVPLTERPPEPSSTATQRRGAASALAGSSGGEGKPENKKPSRNETLAQCAANETSATDPDCGISLPRITVESSDDTTDELAAKSHSLNKRWPFGKAPGHRATDVAFTSSQFKAKDKGHRSTFASKAAAPSWSTTAEASSSLERDLETLEYDADADQGEQKSTALPSVDSSVKETPVSTVSDNSLIETTASGDVARRPNNSQQLKKELLVFHAIILVAVSGAAALAIAFYPGAVKASSSFPVVIENGLPVSVSSVPAATTTHPPLDAPEQVVHREPLYDVCSTEPCQRDGAYIGALISKDMDPCDNFYRFVCGRWKGINDSSSPDKELILKLESEVRHVLVSPLPPSVQDSDILSPLKRVMTSCMNAVSGTNVDPVLDLLAAADLEGFPFTPPIRSSISAWKTSAKVFLLTGASALLKLGVALHPFEPDRDIITVEEPDPLIVGPEKTTTAYRRLMQASMNALGKRFVPAAYATEVVAFTQQLDAAVASGESQRSDERLHRVVKLKDEIELQIYLLEVLGDLQLPPDEEDRDVMLLSPDFSRALVDLLRKTEVHVVLNFLCVHVLVRSSVFVSMADPDLEWAVSAQLFNHPVRHVPRWRLCVRAAAQTLPDLFLYASHQVMGAASNTLHGVLDNVLKQVITHMESLIFLDGQTRVLAKRILSDVRFTVGLPPWLSDMSKVSAYVAKLPLFNNRGNFLKWFSEVNEMVQTSALRRSSREFWRASPFETDCWYDLQLKTVFVPVLLANWTLYRVDELDNLQLPRQGHRAARCLLRMLFEGVSSFFNREILTRSFWSTSAKTSLRRAQLCLQEQAHVPASVTLSLLEDHTALKIIQELYQSNVHISSAATASRGLRDVRLPGAEDFTVDHLFFIYYALGFCASSLREEDEARLVNIPLRGSLMFHEVYGCRPTSKMGPLDKCTAWVAAARQSASVRS